MMAGRTLTAQFAKEARALAPVCLAGLATIAAASLLGARWTSGLELPAFFVGVAALGAWSIGQEYSQRTLSSLLAQPVRRERIFAVKLAALAAMLLALAAFEVTVLGRTRERSEYRLTLVAVPLLWSAGVGPWLTMVARSAVGGAVFTVTLPALLMILIEWLGPSKFDHTTEADTGRLALIWGASAAWCAAGTVFGWRRFMRLEAIDGGGVDLRLPAWLVVRASEQRGVTRRHPYGLLVKKELRLQQITFAVAAVSAIGTSFVASRASAEIADAARVVTLIDVPLVAMLIGALASAEERRLGTLESQLLVPIAAWKQWTVKAGVAVALAIALAFGLPALVGAMSAHVGFRAGLATFAHPTMLTAIVMLTIGSLYVSSACASGLWALLVSAPLVLGTFPALISPIMSAVSAWLYRSVLSRGYRGLGLTPHDRTLLVDAVYWGLIAATTCLLLGLGLRNHRTVDRAARRMILQGILLAASVVTATILLSAAVVLIR